MRISSWGGTFEMPLLVIPAPIIMHFELVLRHILFHLMKKGRARSFFVYVCICFVFLGFRNSTRCFHVSIYFQSPFFSLFPSLSLRHQLIYSSKPTQQPLFTSSTLIFFNRSLAMCEWLESSPPVSYFHAKTTGPISIQSSPHFTRSHEHDYPTPRSSFSTQPILAPPPPPPLSSSISSSSSCSTSSFSARKGSIASLLNSAGELQKLDQEEWSTNYQTHFTPPDHHQHHSATPMMMVDDEEDDDDEDEDDIMSSPSLGTTGFELGTPTPYHQTKKGLRLFSQHVCDILQQHGRATYNQLVQQLIEELKPETSSAAARKTCDPKNIRRRVYDALNVLMAIKFITKDKKEIRWIGGSRYHQQQHSQQPQQHTMLDQENLSFYHQYLNHACDENSDDDDDDAMMGVEEDIQREEQRYQDLLQRIETKRQEIQTQMQQKVKTIGKGFFIVYSIC